MTTSDPNRCFTLRVRLYRKEHDARVIVIHAYDDLGWDEAGRVRLTCEVRHGGKVVFPKGRLTCALHGSSDGVAAKELVLALVAMHPSAGGGEGEEFYADYSPEQLAWVETHGESLDMVRDVRYCDPETGSVRRVG